MVRNKIKMFAQQKVTLPKGRHKIIILDEADRLVSQRFLNNVLLLTDVIWDDVQQIPVCEFSALKFRKQNAIAFYEQFSVELILERSKFELSCCLYMYI